MVTQSIVFITLLMDTIGPVTCLAQIRDSELCSSLMHFHFSSQRHHKPGPCSLASRCPLFQTPRLGTTRSKFSTSLARFEDRIMNYVCAVIRYELHSPLNFLSLMQVDFDTYGYNGASKISSYKYNQIVPQLIIGWGGTNPSTPGGFDYVNSNKSSTWFLQVRL